MTRQPLRRTTAGLGLLALLAVSGCKFEGAASLPLPGGAGGDGYQVKIEFSDVLDLVKQSAVKVDDVTVGTVKEIELSKSGYTAVVTVAIDRKVKLPENATAAIRQTSLLGEKFVSVDRPANATGTLREGMYIPLKSTTRNADIEEVLGALSLVLNGGSIEQLNVINTELTKALKGRESEVRDFLDQLTAFVGGLDDQKAQIVRALEGTDRLMAKLAAQRGVIDVALRDIPRGASVLADERAQLTAMLAGLRNLGTVATRVIQATQQSTIADLRALQPILSQLAVAGKALPDALELLTSYPFPRTVSLPGESGGIRGDYANLYVTIDTSLENALGNLFGVDAPVPAAQPGVRPAPGGTAGAGPVAPTSVTPAELGTDLVSVLLGGLQ
jgi:phospholipid/cholesterol/gamma-HCH transport system substrate-binding protein